MPPVILLAGDDDLLLQRALEQRLATLRDEYVDADVDLRDVSEIDALPELRTTSLFGGTTCVVLRGCEQADGQLKAEIEAYLQSPSPEAILVLVAHGTGKITKIAKLAKQLGERIDVKRPPDWDDRSWDQLVRDEFHRHQRRVDPSAIAAIRLHAGTEPAVIAMQVASVCAASTADTIAAADVEQLIEGRGKASGFAVADAVAARDAASAIVAARGALEAGEAPLALVGALTFRFRQLLQVRSGASAQQAGISPGQYRRLQGIAAGFGPGELAWCYDRLAQLDVDLKSAELPDTLLLEVAIIELATPQVVGAPWNPLAAATAGVR
ncbi:MAG: DNA polymerase III subunit delta [Nitriliruptoraceae bacterium]